MEEKNLKILFIEDQLMDARYIHAMLTGVDLFEAELIIATHLKKAEELLGNLSFDLILLDLNLPDSFGLETLTAITNKTKTIPIILITGVDDEDIALKAIHLGAQDYLIKGEVSKKDFIKSIIYAIERKKSEILLTRYANELKTISESKDKIFRMISHDLRNPLGNIFNLCEILMDDVEKLNKDDIKYYVNEIFKAVKFEYLLLDNLLEWAKINMGNVVVNPEVFDFNNEIDFVISMLNANAVSKNISISAESTQQIKLNADKTMIRSVIQNLINNAIKFTKPNGSIKIHTVKLENKLNFIVEDNGVGIEKELLNDLFNSNSIKTRRGTNDEKGTGFGLLICKEMIEKNNGKISVESEVNKGSKFIVTFPLSNGKTEKVKNVDENRI